MANFVAPHRKAARAGTLAGILSLAFALFGNAIFAPGAEHLDQAPIDLDLATRALSLGWLESSEMIPVTIVDIDEKSFREWGSPPVTPRDRLLRMLEVITAAGPMAVIVDIDLAGNEEPGGEDAGRVALLDFLRQYDGPAPLIFPKRVEEGEDGLRRMAPSMFDEVFAKNSRLAWGHADFETDGGGTLRRWRTWLEVCTVAGAAWLPSVSVRLAALVRELPHGLERPAAPSALHGACGANQAAAGPEQRLLIGPRLTGPRRALSDTRGGSIAAALVANPDNARDDRQLFGGRVVLVGATHIAAGDLWITPSGVLPGVELLANTIRFAPLLRTEEGTADRWGHRLAAVLLFLAVAWLEWILRKPFAALGALVCTVLLVRIGLGTFSDLGVFEAVESAIWLVVLYKVLQGLLDLLIELKDLRGSPPSGAGGWAKALLLVCRREPDHHEEAPR